MSSNIDETKPVAGSPTTASVRANFAAAKAEIVWLQNFVKGLFVSKQDKLRAGANIAILNNEISSSLPAHTHSSNEVTDFVEGVDDALANSLIAGANILISHNEPNNTFTISAVTGLSPIVPAAASMYAYSNFGGF